MSTHSPTSHNDSANAMSRAKEILEGMEKVPLDQMRAELSGGGRSSEFAIFKKVALERLEPGGEPYKAKKLTESEVSSIRTQVDHLNDDGAEEKEYRVRRQKMKRDNGTDYVDDRDGEEVQLYKVFIRQRDLNDTSETEEEKSQDLSAAEQTNGEKKEDEYESEAEKAFEEIING